MELLPDIQRIDARGSLATSKPHTEPLAFAQVPPRHIHKQRHSVLTDDESASGLLHRPVLRYRIETGADPDRKGVASQPESQIQDRQSQVEHRSATRLLLTLSPAQ